MSNIIREKYTETATSATPALIIYLIDVSKTMEIMIGGKSRLEAVSKALAVSREKMYRASKKGNFIANRYRIAYILYSEKAKWVSNKIFTISEIAKIGIPKLQVRNDTNAYSAFIQAENILKMELPNIRRHPAPLVCHITDGKYNGKDPIPVANRIKSMRVNDGNVLIQNIFITDKLLQQPINDPKAWAGITNQTKFTNPYGETLKSISSQIPESYRRNVNIEGYNLAKGSLMMFPGVSLDLIELGFVISTATPRTIIKEGN